MTCDSDISPYKYEPAGHVVTGNLNIVKNRHLGKLLLTLTENKIIFIGTK